MSVNDAAFVAGHSLGEYTALCAADSFDLATTARLLRLRGEAMQAAVPVGQGAMAALLGGSLDDARALAEAAAEGEVCVVANDNDPTQVVISGHAGAIGRAIATGQGARAFKPCGIKLPVSAPFHSPLMAPRRRRDARRAWPSTHRVTRFRAADGQRHRRSGDQRSGGDRRAAGGAR